MRTTRFVLLLAGAAMALASIAPRTAAFASAGAPASDSPVTFVAGSKTRAAFEKGSPLVETDAYKVHASRREGPGMAEIHTRDTDIIYVLDGTATLVTGGRAVDLETTAPFELRGARIDGGEERALARGDLVIVPQGVPHWFKAASKPFLYYVVKTTGEEAAGVAGAFASVNLGTREGVALLNAQWRYSDARVVESAFNAPDASGQATGATVKTFDYTPHAGVAGFDDSAWEVIDATTLAARRGAGRLSFNWYRLALTVPPTVNGVDTTGATITLETTLDDYAEIWVDGELPRHLGQRGGSVIAGWNASNRLVIGRNVRPGQTIQLAIFGANGPISNPPTNFIFVRDARLYFHAGDRVPVAVPPQEVNVDVVRHDPAIEQIVGPNLKAFKLAEGFQFTEGPVWDARTASLLFSDPNSNTIYRYAENGGLSVFRTPSGYAGADIADYKQPGSNGLAFDGQGRLTINEHGNRRVSRLEADGTLTVLADRYQGRRLNSPNDLVYRSDGALFFTDPPFGLPQGFDDPRKELAFSGVYALIDGTLRLLTAELSGPNGLAFSPDEKTLYVGNWDEQRKVVMAYDVAADGTLSNRRVFADTTSAAGEDAIDGIKVDRRGNVYVSGPGGLWVFSRGGIHLGTIALPRHVHNMAWGPGGAMYLAARDRLYRLALPQ